MLFNWFAPAAKAASISAPTLSISVVRMLERFLRSGVEPATAMKILNSVMLLRGGGGWGFATVDLMCVDLFSGETCFYKYGAAPSYVKNGKSIRRIKGETLYLPGRTTRFIPIQSLDDIPGARWYPETKGYGGLEYWLPLSYVAGRGVRLIEPAAEE